MKKIENKIENINNEEKENIIENKEKEIKEEITY